MTNKIFKSISLVVILSATGYLLSFAQDKADLNKDVETLQRENARLSKELDNANKLNSQLESKSKELYLNKQEYDKMKKDLAGLSKAADDMNKERVALKQENDNWRSERSKLYQDAGTAYVKAGLYDNALEDYNKSLTYDPNNADVNYYLGLLYQKTHKNPVKAAAHLKRYLYLKPDADNKEEVNYLIEMALNQR